MTRLIDADALKKALKSNCTPELCHDFNTAWCERCCRTNDFEDLIDESPTVEERPKGKWIDRNGETWCANCQKNAIYLASGRYLKTDFCPHCGADMREVEE